MLSFNLAHPVTPDMLIYKNSPDFVNALLLSMMSLAVFVSSPKWGQLTKRWEIKKIMVWTPFFYGLMQIGFVIFFNPYIMLIFRFAAGLFAAGWTVSLTIYINNLSASKDKTRNFGLILATSALGGIIGQLISGRIGLISETSFYIPFFLQLFIGFVVGILLIIFIKPLNRIVDKEQKSIKFQETLQIIKKNNLVTPFLTMLVLVVALALYTSNIGFYAAQQFNFNSLHVSYINCYTNLLILVVNLFIIVRLEQRFGAKIILRMQILFGFIAIVLAVIVPVFTIRGLFISLFIIFVCAVRPIVSKLVAAMPEADVPILLGAINSVNALGVIIGASSAGFLYAINYNWPFYAIIFVLFIGLVINWGRRNNEV